MKSQAGDPCQGSMGRNESSWGGQDKTRRGRAIVVDGVRKSTGLGGRPGGVILDRPEDPWSQVDFQIRTRVVVFQFEASSVFEISIRKTCNS